MRAGILGVLLGLGHDAGHIWVDHSHAATLTPSVGGGVLLVLVALV